MPLEVATAIEFMLEIISSVSVLPPLNQATVCPTIVEVKVRRPGVLAGALIVYMP